MGFFIIALGWALFFIGLINSSFDTDVDDETAQKFYIASGICFIITFIIFLLGK